MQAQPSIKGVAEAVNAALGSPAGESLAAHPQYDAFIAEDECRRISGLSKSERWRRIHAGTFPAPVNLGISRCSRYSLRAILEWQQAILAKNPQSVQHESA